jgi:hypothetical protein
MVKSRAFPSYIYYNTGQCSGVRFFLAQNNKQPSGWQGVLTMQICDSVCTVPNQSEPRPSRPRKGWKNQSSLQRSHHP